MQRPTVPCDGRKFFEKMCRKPLTFAVGNDIMSTLAIEPPLY